jgi:hypothetical protein
MPGSGAFDMVHVTHTDCPRIQLHLSPSHWNLLLRVAYHVLIWFDSFESPRKKNEDIALTDPFPIPFFTSIHAPM